MTDKPDAPPEQPKGFRQAPPPDPDRVKPSKSSARTRKPSTRSRRSGPTFETRVGGFLFQTNVLMQQVPFLKTDALDANELVLLTRGIVDEANKHPTFKRYIEFALDSAGAGGLIMAVGIIVGRRLSRHGAIPDGLIMGMPGTVVDDMLGGLAQMSVQADRQTAAEMNGRMAQQPPASLLDFPTPEPVPTPPDE
jgi:hypothetical protein